MWDIFIGVWGGNGWVFSLRWADVLGELTIVWCRTGGHSDKFRFSDRAIYWEEFSLFIFSLTLISYLMELAGLIMMMYYIHFSTIVSCKRYLSLSSAKIKCMWNLSLYTRHIRTDFIWILGLTILDFASYFLNHLTIFT